MNELVEILQTYNIVTIMVFILLLIVGIKWIIETVKFFKNLVENWRLKKNGEETKANTLDERVKKLEEHDKWQYDELKSQSTLLEEMKELMVQMQVENSKNIVATNRSTLKRISDEVLSRGFITEIEYETFKDLADIYIAHGGNHTMKDKIIPQVLNLPIR